MLFIGAAVSHRIELALLWWLPAWALDALDGWLARRLRQETSFGYIFDKITDRLVLVGGLLIVLTEQLIPDYGLLLITKDIAALPALSWQIKRRGAMPSLGVFGKMMSTLQGIGFVWLLLGWPGGFPVTITIAILGGISGFTYLRRTIAGE